MESLRFIRAVRVVRTARTVLFARFRRALGFIQILLDRLGKTAQSGNNLAVIHPLRTQNADNRFASSHGEGAKHKARVRKRRRTFVVADINAHPVARTKRNKTGNGALFVLRLGEKIFQLPRLLVKDIH